jgi:hypothetical protein
MATQFSMQHDAHKKYMEMTLDHSLKGSYGPIDAYREYCSCGQKCTHSIQYTRQVCRKSMFVNYILHFCYSCINNRIVHYWNTFHEEPYSCVDFQKLVQTNPIYQIDQQLDLPTVLHSEVTPFAGLPLSYMIDHDGQIDKCSGCDNLIDRKHPKKHVYWQEITKMCKLCDARSYEITVNCNNCNTVVFQKTKDHYCINDRPIL